MNPVRGMVSVVIPCYNNAQYLRRCIDSVLAQTFTDFEIIIVNDGSTDNPSSVLSDIDDPRLHKIIDMPHSGVSTARNVGIYHAIGEYIVFIDGDDWVENNHLELLVVAMESADCAVIMMQIDYPERCFLDKAILKFFKSNREIRHRDFNLLFENYLLSSPCNKIYRANLVKHLNYLQFDRSITYAEDLLFNLEYFQMLKSVVLLPEATYHYVKHGESGTTRFHQNTAYTLSRISCNVKKSFGPNLSRETLSILMKHYLWGLFNLHHTDSHLTDFQVCAEINLILSIPEYDEAKSVLSTIGISRNLQLLLKYGNHTLIHTCLKHKIR